MKKHQGSILAVLCLLFTSFNTVSSTCSMTDTVCEFWLEIEAELTMMYGPTAVYPANGKLYAYDVTDTANAEPINASDVITTDGWEDTRLVVSVNKSMPGPPIEVYEGQTLIVHVKNLMSVSSVSVHWHGLHQEGTPWMDGVAFITQCPIQPGQSFTYKFKAYPRGTFWYHSHIGSQLGMGLIGPLIIREKKPQPMKEFVMMLQEWNHDFDSDLIYMKMLRGNYEKRKKVQPSQSQEGALFSMYPFQSGLINGKGRFYNCSGIHNGAPLSVFTVERGDPYRFRVIGAGAIYPFRVSIDDHNLVMIACDGYDIKPVVVESFIINPGERYDFTIDANQPVDNYWIRAQTLEINVKNHVAEAILRYEGAPEQDPVSSKTKCTETNRCKVLNCPFSYYPEGSFTDCVSLDRLAMKDANPTPGGDDNNPEEIEDLFLNFAFPGGHDWTPGSVNGKQFLFPPVSALTQPQEISTACQPGECGVDKICTCTSSIVLEHNKVYQMIILNMGRGAGWAHPVHMHGHSFHVVKLGFPTYNESTGRLIEENLDVDCGGNPDRSESFCSAAKWANNSWGGNNIPGLNLESSIRKDTIIVPTGGYVVVRIRANNPGVWFMHCHIELHSSNGMAIMINESFSKQAALPPPPGFPRCNKFDYLNNPAERDTYTKELFWAVVGPLIPVVIIQFVVIMVLCLRMKIANCHRAEAPKK